jgi:hypothetical protein
MRALLEADADTTLLNPDGETALQLAENAGLSLQQVFGSYKADSASLTAVGASATAVVAAEQRRRERLSSMKATDVEESALSPLRQWARTNLDDDSWSQFVASRDEWQALRTAHGLQRANSNDVPSLRAPPMRKIRAVQMITEFRSEVSKLLAVPVPGAEGA